MLNQVFNRLTVIKDDGGEKVLCRCECGNQKWINRTNVKSGGSKSCGCYRNEQVRRSNATHGKSHTRFWNIHTDMMRRCYDNTRNNYERYGGAGVYVVPEWHNVEAFMTWCEQQSPAPGLTIDRIDTKGPYGPSNCRFTDKKVQSRNRKNLVRYEYRGESLILAEIIEKYHPTLELRTVWNRLNKGDSIEQALRPVKQKRGP